MRRPICKSVNAIEKYKIQVHFTDGTHGIYDVSHLAGRGVFKAWDVEDTFTMVFINPESNAITWPGELVIDTINVYCSLKKIKVDDHLTPTLQHAPY